MGSSGTLNMMVAFFLGLIVIAMIFAILRGVILWFWKIDVIVKCLTEVVVELKKLSNEKKPKEG